MKKLFLLLSFSIISAMSHAIVDDGLKDILLGCDPHLTKSLNGIWQLKVASGISNDKKVPKPDMSWGSIPVPGCWEAYGFCQPKYDYPDSLTGYYRTTFTVPKAWKDKRVILRFDGVLHSYDLWINGKEVGNWNKAFNTCLFDITPFLSNNVYSGEPQELAMRVTSRPTGYEFDCFDDWAPSGIFRDVTLFPVPDTHLADYMVETRQLKGNNAQMRFSFKVFNPKSTTHLRISIFSPFGAPVGTPVILNLDRDDKVIYETNVSDASLWTAETPNLYTIKAELMNKKKILQTMTKKFGIRQMTIEGNIVKINDKPIKFRGVNAHSTDPFTVKVINDTLTLKDMKLMKEASVNYIRTSHYPREPRFYELADSLGFYVVSEVPFCYGDKHLTDTTYLPNLLERAHATVNRDKSHACIMIWSIGNENPFTKMEKLVGAEVKRVDSSRPICFPQRGSTFRSLMKKGNPFPEFIDIYAPHYPSVGTLNTFFQHQERPVLFTEYCHSVGGSFEDHDKMWEIIQNSPGILGGSVWEWADQGIPFKAQLKDRYGVEHRVFTSSHGGFEMNGNKGTDGMVYANRIPLPNYYELQHNYAQAAVLDTILHYDATTSSIKLNICNRFDFTNLKDTKFSWSLTADRRTIGQGNFSPSCQPHESILYRLNVPDLSNVNNKNCLLNIDIQSAQGYTILHQSIPVGKMTVYERLVEQMKSSGDPMDYVKDGILIRAGRKISLGEELRAKTRLSRYLLRLNDKLVAGNDTFHIKATLKTQKVNGGKHVSYTLMPDSTNVFLSEFGLAMLLDSSLNRVQWIGNGPYAIYPGRNHADKYGLWGLRFNDLYLEGNREGVDAAWISDAQGNGVLLVCNRKNVNFEQTDQGLVLSVNAAVSGIGPKGHLSSHGVIASKIGRVDGDFYLYKTTEESLPPLLKKIFKNPKELREPFHPFETQYETYLMHYDDIIDR